MASTHVSREHLSVLSDERLAHLCARVTHAGEKRRRISEEDTAGTREDLLSRLVEENLSYGDLEFEDLETIYFCMSGKHFSGGTKLALIELVLGAADSADEREPQHFREASCASADGSSLGSGIDVGINSGSIIRVTEMQLNGLSEETLRKVLGRLKRSRVELTSTKAELVAELLQRRITFGDLALDDLKAVLLSMGRRPLGARTIPQYITRITSDEPGLTSTSPRPKLPKAPRPPRPPVETPADSCGPGGRKGKGPRVPPVVFVPWNQPPQPPKPEAMQPPRRDSNYKEYRTSFKSIAMFNHKGGVGKTTAALQYGYAAAAKGIKTIVIDADSQGSAGTSALRQMMEESGHTFQSLHATLAEPSSYGAALLRWSTELTPASAIELARFPAPAVHGSPGPSGSASFIEDSWLKIVPGDSKLVVYEDALSQQLERLREIGVDPRKCAGAFTNVGLLTAHHYGAELLIYDLSPTFSRLNRIAVATCDFWIMPCNAEMTVVDSVDMMRRIMTPRHVPRVVGGDISLFDDIEEYAREQHDHHDGAGPYPLPRFPSSVLLGTIVSAYNNVADGLPSMTVRGTIHRLGIGVNELRGVLNDFARIPAPPAAVAGGAAVPLPAARDGMAAGAMGAGPGYQNRLLGHNFSVTDAEVAAAHVSNGFARDTLCISMMPNYTSLNSVGATLGVPVPFLDIDRIRNLCEWSLRVRRFYGSREVMFPFQDDYAGRIEAYRNATKAAIEDIFRLMVRVFHRPGEHNNTSPQLLHKLTLASGSALRFREMVIGQLPPGPYMVCPFDTCLTLGNAPLQGAHQEELQWLAHRALKEQEFTASMAMRR